MASQPPTRFAGTTRAAVAGHRCRSPQHSGRLTCRSGKPTCPMTGVFAGRPPLASPSEVDDGAAVEGARAQPLIGPRLLVEAERLDVVAQLVLLRQRDDLLQLRD